MYYIEIPQEVTNENTVILIYYLAQQKTVTLHVLLWMGYSPLLKCSIS